MYGGKIDFQPAEEIFNPSGTIGAGDCFVGRFAAAIALQVPWWEAIRLAQQAARELILRQSAEQESMNPRQDPRQDIEKTKADSIWTRPVPAWISVATIMLSVALSSLALA
jgi:hypothetical protein